MAKPNRARSTSRVVRSGAKAEASSNTEKLTTLSIRIGRRPYFSASQPKNRAPSGRIARVSEMPTATSWILTWKSSLIAVRHRTKMKKSKASSDQPASEAK